jgi:hypothetical protein
MACAIDCLWWAMTRPESQQFVIAPTADQARIIWSAAKNLAQSGPLAGLIARVVESPFPQLELVTRDDAGREVTSIISARSVSHDARYLRGHGADRILVDEVAFVPNMVMTQTVPPMLAASQYRELVLIGTPFGIGSYFHKAFLAGQEGHPDTRSFHYPSASSPLLSAEYLERQRLEMTQLAYQTEYEALFLDDQASVFRFAVIQAAIDPDLSPGPVPGHRYMIGYDPAKYTDRSGIVVLDVTALPHRAVEVLDIGGRDYLLQASEVARLAGIYHSASVLLDATAHDQMLEELKVRGVRAKGYVFTNTSKQELIDRLVLALERGELRIPHHEALIRELVEYGFRSTAAGNVHLGAPERAGSHDDLVHALALAVRHSTSSSYTVLTDYDDPHQEERWRISL